MMCDAFMTVFTKGGCSSHTVGSIVGQREPYMPGIKVQDVLCLWFNTSTDHSHSTLDDLYHFLSCWHQRLKSKSTKQRLK